MRKWVVAGVALAVICAVGYLPDRPRIGTVEYHKKEWLKMADGPVDNWITRSAPRPIAKMCVQRQVRKLRFHQDSLLKLGYLETRWFTVTNRTPYDVVLALTTVSPEPQFGGYFQIGTNSTNEVGVTVARDEMARWERAIRELDVPENGKTDQFVPHP